MSSITNRSTKAEIYKAYELLVKQLETERASNAKLQKELSERSKVIQKAEVRVEKVGGDQIEALQNNLNQQLETFKKQWQEEQQAFQELQQAIRLEKEHLEEFYNIKKQAESLDALVLAHNEAKANLNKEIAAEKERFKQEVDQAKQSWNREKEAYEYEQSIKRRNETNEYEAKKIQQEKELEEKRLNFEESMTKREAVLVEKETELQELRQKVGDFEGQLKKAIDTTKEETTNSLTTKFQFEKQLELKDLNAELKLKDQMIQNLESKIEDQNLLIKQLTNKADSASDQVKDIALKAIEKSGGSVSRLSNYLERERIKESKD